MEQQFINWVLGLSSMLIGFLIRTIWQAVKDLQAEDKVIADKVASIEVLVAGEYMKKGEFERISAAIFKKLDKIDDLLRGKVDKDSH